MFKNVVGVFFLRGSVEVGFPRNERSPLNLELFRVTLRVSVRRVL